MRIATEEAWAPAELLARYRKLLEEKPASWDPGFHSCGDFSRPDAARDAARERIQDLGARRLADMDASGIAKQIVFLTAPGVQVFDAATAVSLSNDLNDRLIEKSTTSRTATPRWPQSPPGPVQSGKGAAARDLARLQGRGDQLAHAGRVPRRAEVLGDLRGGRALDVPLYLHPNTPPPAMIAPFLPRGLDGAIYGFAVETGLHLLRIIVAGSSTASRASKSSSAT